MKVDMNQVSGDNKPKDRVSKKLGKANKNVNKKVSSSSPDLTDDSMKSDGGSGVGNVYKESLEMYKNKYKNMLHDGDIFRQNKFWIILIVMLFIVFLSTNSRMSAAKTQLTVRLKRATAETENLNNAITETKANLEEQARIDSIKLTDDEEELARNNAIEQGKMVENLQNRYKKILPPDVPSDHEDYRVLWNTYLDELTDNSNSLAAYFGESDKNAKTEWYSSINGIPGTWEFASKAPFKGSMAKVLWLCYADDDHTLLAYCTAQYHVDTKLFTNVTWKMTGYALANLKSDDNSATEQITSMIDGFKSITDDVEITSPSIDEEFDDETITNNNAMSDARQSLKQAAANGLIDGEEYDLRYNVGIDGSDESSTEQ